MPRFKTSNNTPAHKAIRRASGILSSLEADNADFVALDDRHPYLYCQEQLVNLYDHHELIEFLTRHDYMKPQTDNKMIVTAWIIFEGLRRCQ